MWRDTPRLTALLGRLPPYPKIQIIVAASTEERDEVEAAAAGCSMVHVTTGRRGRGAQMNAGARLATGEWLLFLHADSSLPTGAFDEIARAAADPRTVGGSFRFTLDDPGWRARLIEWGAAGRSRWCHLPYGDQGIFVKRAAFEALGGYADIPVMEDVDLVRRLRRVGRLYRSPLPLTTSARRWQRDGWVRRVASNWWLMAMYSAGVDPRRLARRYEGRRSSVVAVLGRAPSSGGKTRLFRSLRIAPDAALAHALLGDTLAVVEQVAGTDRVLFYTPAGSGREVQSAAATPWTCLEQRGRDLGERMACAFEDLHALGYDEMILIGSDLPTLDPDVIVNAIHAIRHRSPRVVLGPSADGGYYLVGLRHPAPGLFEGVDWSTPMVLEQTVGRAGALGLPIHLVDQWYDVDDAESLRRAVGESSASRTAAWWRARAADLNSA